MAENNDNGQTLTDEELSEQKLAAEEAKKAEKVKEMEKLAVEIAEEVKFHEATKKAAELAKSGPVSPDGISGLAFVKAFSKDGAVWFAEGKTFTEAQALYTKKLEARVDDLEKILTAAKAGLGGKDVIEFQDDDAKDSILKKRVDELTPKLGKGIARFAAAMRVGRN